MTEQTTTAVQTATPVQAATASKTTATPSVNNQTMTYKTARGEVALTFQDVKNTLVRGDSTKITDKEVTLFMHLCKIRQLNPFDNDVYLVKYGTTPAQMVVSKEAFLKRAFENPDFDGIEAGIIVQRGEEWVELEGCCRLPQDAIIGGWAKVYCKNRRVPFVAKVNFWEFNKGQATWKEMPALMIRKVAEAQALREAFPVQLSSMYIQEESAVQEADYTEIKSASLDEVAKQAAEGK